jgi:hypothetical protein
MNKKFLSKKSKSDNIKKMIIDQEDLKNYNKNKLKLKYNDKINFNINLENINPSINLSIDDSITEFYSYVEVNNNKNSNLFTSIGLYTIQTDNSNKPDTFLYIEDANKDDNDVSILNTKSISFDNKIDYCKNRIIINDDNKFELNYNNIKFNDTYISQLNNQILFNKSHIDKGHVKINNINSSIVSFINSYPHGYSPTVIIRLFNTTIISPLLVTNITNNNFSWFSKEIISGSIVWIAF